jgi:hypothetical protein
MELRNGPLKRQIEAAVRDYDNLPEWLKSDDSETELNPLVEQ